MLPKRIRSGALLLMLLPVAALAQDFTARFWLAGLSKNAVDCMAFDPQFTREHTLTVRDGRATLTSPGGIQTNLRLVKPGVYEEETDFASLQLKVVADLNDKSLTVSDKYIGCWWTAKWN